MKHNIIKKLVFFVVILMIVNLSLSYAQQEKQDTAKTTESTTNTLKKEKEEKNKVYKRKFVPSEKINADSSVSFPVDI